MVENGLGLGSMQGTTSVSFTKAVQLPHGAVVTAVIVWGENSSNTWILQRAVLGTPTTIITMASGNQNSSDTSISNATIDNSAYVYELGTGGASGEYTSGARITYTTDYI